MTALDWLLLLIIAVSALLGAMRGLIGVVASLAAWLLAGLAAFHFGGDAGLLLASQGTPSWGESLSGYVLAFLAVWLLVTLLGWALRRLADSAGLTPVDRAMGLGLGAARGLFLACALLLALGLSSVPREPVWRESVGVDALVPMAAWMREGVPDWMAQRMVLEGRGASFGEQVHAQLQAQAQALQSMQASGEAVQDLAAAARSGPDSGLPAPVPDADTAVIAATARDRQGATG